MKLTNLMRLAAVAAALHGAVAPASAQELKKLKIGILKMAALTNAWVANRDGIFKRNGIDAQLIEFKNGGDAVIAQQSGDVDIILSIPGTAFTAIERGFDLTAIFQNETATPTAPASNSLQVLVDSPIKSVKDLAGKKIGISGFHSQSAVNIENLLKKNGISVDSVQFVEIPPPAEVVALKSKQVDAVDLPDPYTTQLIVSGVGRPIAWSAKDSISEQPLGVWFAKRKFVHDNPTAVAEFDKSLQESIDYMLADPDRARKDVAAYTGLDPDLVQHMPMVGYNYKVDPKKWQAVVDMMEDNGEMHKPHQASEYISDALKPFVATN